MKVKRFIEELQKFDPELDVVDIVYDSDTEQRSICGVAPALGYRSTNPDISWALYQGDYTQYDHIKNRKDLYPVIVIIDDEGIER